MLVIPFLQILSWTHHFSKILRGSVLILAVFAFQSGVTAEPSHTELHKSLKSKKWSEALDGLVALREKNPDSVLIATDLAQVYLRLGRRLDAIQTLKPFQLSDQIRLYSTLFLKNDNLKLYQSGTYHLSKFELSPAIDSFERVLAQEPNNSEVQFRLAQSYFLDEQYSRSDKLFKEIADTVGPYLDPDLSNELGFWRILTAAYTGQCVELPHLIPQTAPKYLSSEEGSVALLLCNKLDRIEKTVDANPNYFHLKLVYLKTPPANGIEEHRRPMPSEKELEMDLSKYLNTAVKPLGKYAVDFKNAESLRKQIRNLKESN